ncbi:hydantoinase/oxoprolinase family protein [Streptomyces sp. NPDC096538]|uniref:hydantoinase/oxoprolinase family protein n=1 Tax=Streptomyces sp. NPDC096538 TaxID=3155427 RepID=UPI00332E8A25
MHSINNSDGYSIGIDIGGTFTDCVVTDSRGQSVTTKALSTSDDPVRGVRAALSRLAEGMGRDSASLLTHTRRFSHGTTIGTNAVLEHRGARVGLVTTAGHGDTLAMMRGRGRVAGRPVEDVFRVQGSLPRPLIVPGAVLEVQERVDRSGAVVVALDAPQVRDELRRFIARHDLDAVAVVLLWSFVNPVHERLITQLVAEVSSETYISSSVNVSPRLGEFERMVATVINAYVGPVSGRYMGRLAEELKDGGLTTPLLIMQSNGGVLPAVEAVAAPLGTIDSGPAGGLAGVRELAEAAGHDRVITSDMGGTSFDIGLIVDGAPVMAEEKVIDRHTYRLTHLDVRSVACGGGTIARRDSVTGAMRVGPDSAGSDPGPACYGRGGTQPTVTDADVVLGLIRPESFLEGRMQLDPELSRAAVGRLAAQLGLTQEETAAGIVNINNMRAATLIHQQTVERGLDPRDFRLYAYGGAGPVHAFGFAAEAGVREVIIPLGNGASTLSAYGITVADTLHCVEVERTVKAPFDDGNLVNAVDEAVRRVRAASERAGTAATAVRISVHALMRFEQQLANAVEIPVPLPAQRGTGALLLKRFNTEYARRYGAGGTNVRGTAEVFALRAEARVSSDVPPGTQGARRDDAGAAHTCEVYWPTIHRWLVTDVHNQATLDRAGQVSGPALVELSHTTVCVPPGATVFNGPHGHLTLHLPDPSAPCYNAPDAGVAR